MVGGCVYFSGSPLEGRGQFFGGRSGEGGQERAAHNKGGAVVLRPPWSWLAALPLGLVARYARL